MASNIRKFSPPPTLRPLASVEISSITIHTRRAKIGKTESGQLLQALHRIFGENLNFETGKITIHLFGGHIHTIDFPDYEA